MNTEHCTLDLTYSLLTAGCTIITVNYMVNTRHYKLNIKTILHTALAYAMHNAKRSYRDFPGVHTNLV